jgi:hypothetical protein
MKQKNKNKINFFFYTIIIAIVWSFLSVSIDLLIGSETILSGFLKAFIFVMISGILAYTMFYYFRGFYKKGELK